MFNQYPTEFGASFSIVYIEIWLELKSWPAIEAKEEADITTAII
jgi:hypothetical protein